MVEIKEPIWRGWKALGIIFICLFVIACLTTWAATSSDSANRKYYSGFYPCQSGQEERCVPTGYHSLPYNCQAGNQLVCYDDRVQSETVCNSAESVVARCVSNDYTRTVSCNEGYTAQCVLKNQNTNIASCDAGTSPQCLDESKWGYWTGTYFVNCNAGDVAQCAGA
jgi:hypothetical protein